MPTFRPLLVLPLLAVLVAGCGGSSSGGATPTTVGSQGTTESAAPHATAPADTAAATTEITKNWTKFFDYRTPLATEFTLLQGGKVLAPAVHTAQQEQAKTHIKQLVKVKKVSFTSPTQATVYYSLYNGSTVLLNNSAGVAVLDNGTWKVSKITFCTLVQLGNNNKPVPSCS